MNDDRLVPLRRNADDPIHRDAEKHDHDEGMSPMDPPDAYSPPTLAESVPYEEMHPFLRELRDEHEGFVRELDTFDELLTKMLEVGIDRPTYEAMHSFFGVVDSQVIPHNRREERVLFPLLAARLLEHGEHSRGSTKTTAVDVLERDHLQVIQHSAVILNFFGIASHIPDPTSRGVVLETAIQQGKALVEMLRLHIFREDHLVFSLAHRYLSTEELDRMRSQL
ncbi:MAG: hemerythrin domain-containing protein [Polyangiaceae bacterium]|nr:hemerythrin domain-containing protein [Polyangiaceae bacterium]